MSVYWKMERGRKGQRGVAGWWYRFIKDGRRYEAFGFQTRADAQEAEARLRGAVRGLEPKRIRTTFRELATEYFRQCETRCTQRHFQNQMYRYKKWFRRISALEVSALTPQVVGRQVRRWASSSSPTTANRNLDFMRSILRTGLDAGMISHTEAFHRVLGVKRLPVDPPEKYVPSREDIVKVLAAADERDRRMIAIYLGTLARKRELFDLPWEDVDLEAGSVVLTTHKTAGRGAKRVAVAMTPEVREAFAWLWEHRRSDRWVFPSPKTGEPYYDRNKWFERMCQRAGVTHFNFHSLRHYASNLAARRGATRKQQQEIGRRENLSTADGYPQPVREVSPETIMLVRDPLSLTPSYPDRIRKKGRGRKGKK